MLYEQDTYKKKEKVSVMNQGKWRDRKICGLSSNTNANANAQDCNNNMNSNDGKSES